MDRHKTNAFETLSIRTHDSRWCSHSTRLRDDVMRLAVLHTHYKTTCKKYLNPLIMPSRRGAWSGIVHEHFVAIDRRLRHGTISIFFLGESKCLASKRANIKVSFAHFHVCVCRFGCGLVDSVRYEGLEVVVPIVVPRQSLNFIEVMLLANCLHI